MRESGDPYRLLFEKNPSPMYVWDVETLAFLAVNEATIAHYGYSRDEFLRMAILDIRPPEEIRRLLAYITKWATLSASAGLDAAGVWRHRKKDGTLFDVEITWTAVTFNGRPAALVLAQDITARQRAEEQTRFYADTVKNIPIGMAVWRLEDLDDVRTFRLVSVNPAALPLTGRTEEELLGKSMWEVFPVFMRTGIPETYREVILSGKAKDLGEVRYGDERIREGVFAIKAFPLPGRCVGLAFEDITQRKRTEEALRTSEQRLRNLAAVSPVGIFITDADGHCLYVNDRWCEITGLTLPEAQGRGWAHALHPGDRARVTAEWYEAARSQRPFQSEYRFQRPDGVVTWVLGQAMAERDRVGNLVGYIGTITDITERKQAQEQLGQSLENLRTLSRRMETIREEERGRIARQVHDELGGTLACLKLDLDRLKALATRTDAGEVRAELQSRLQPMRQLVDQTMALVQRIASDLRPAVLDDLGLVAAVEWQARDFQTRTGIACTVCPHGQELPVDRECATALFRICQEALVNVARHAQATGVRIRLSAAAGQLVLEIQDDGAGIPEAKVTDPQSLGLLGMRERGTALGGEVRIQGVPGVGTTITVRMPLRRSSSPT